MLLNVVELFKSVLHLAASIEMIRFDQVNGSGYAVERVLPEAEMVKDHGFRVDLLDALPAL